MYSRQLKLLFIAWSAICTLLAFQLITTEVFQPEVYNTVRIIAFPLIRILVGGFLIAFLIIPAYNYLKVKNQTSKIFGFVILGLVVSILMSFFYKYGIAHVTGWSGLHAILEDTRQEIIFGLYHNVTYYLVFISALFAMDYLEAKRLAIRKRDSLSAELAQTKLSVLQNQLQPHFLFNALNGISSTIEDRKEAAQDMIADLSDLLRNSLETDFTSLVSLEVELKILDSYLNIEKRRFEHQLNIEKDIDSLALSKNIPPFLFQPLVENAIKHGFSEGIKRLDIKIVALLDDNHLILSVKNNGAKLEESHGGIGVKNLKERLINIYGKQVDFHLEQRGDWVVNEIKIGLE